MRTIETKILNLLLDKYEKSKTFSGDNKVNQRFMLYVGDVFPKYKDHSDYEMFKRVNEAIDYLKLKNYIFATISRSNVVDSVVLNTDCIDQVYADLNRTPKRAIHQSLQAVLMDYQNEHPILQSYCSEQLNRIQANKPIHYFNQDIEEFNQLLYAIKRLLMVEEEIYVRDFSVLIFNDSKKFERIKSKVENLLFEYGDFPTKENILQSLNVIKNPSYVYFKGEGVVVLNHQAINLASLSSDIGISSMMIKDIETIKVNAPTVITVENLTTFHRMSKENKFVIYLGGFHNQVRREFIHKIHRQNQGVEFYHFGDIDAGGFYIFEHLKRLSGVPFKPYKMNVETLIAYKSYAKQLTSNDRKRLLSFDGDEFTEVIHFMLEHDMKLEQEAIRELE